MELRQGKPKRSQSKKFRRQVWLQIYLPVFSGFFILGILVASLSLNQKGTASVFADASLTIVLILLLGLGLILLVLLIAFSYLVARMVGCLPTPMSRIYSKIKMLDQSTQRFARIISRPFMFPSAVAAAIAAVLRGLASIFKQPT